MKFYSEHGEDKWIYKHIKLPKKGIYVDVGAAHPTRMSNTAFLRDLGWTGIQIDADPFWIPYWNKIGQFLINCPVWIDNKGVGFNSNKSAHRLSKVDPTKKTNPSLTLNEILSTYGVDHIDFMSLDVEGMEFDIFQSLHTQFWPDTLVFEYDTVGETDYRLQQFFRTGTYYKELHQTANNFIFHHTDRSYDYHRTCWRYTYGNVDEGENHPCYFCGYDLPMKFVDKRECVVCGIMVCPSCKNCLCTITDEQYSTLIRIHEKYCCNLPEYSNEIELEKPYDQAIVDQFVKVLNTCWGYEYEKGNL